MNRLIYYEEFTRAVDAIAREKEIKGWRRAKKLILIARLNPEWRELVPTRPDPSASLRERSG